MNWHQLDDLRRESSRDETLSASDPANVLNQVLLPVVLILALMVVAFLNDAKEESEQLRDIRSVVGQLDLPRLQQLLLERGRELEEGQGDLQARAKALGMSLEDVEAKLAETESQRKLVEDEEHESRLNEIRREAEALERKQTELALLVQEARSDKLAEMHAEAILEIQKQRLVAALQRVELSFRVQLGIGIEPLASPTLDSKRFRDACQVAFSGFATSSAAEVTRSKLFARVLEEASIRDLRQEGASGSRDEHLSAALRARNSVISAENRAFVVDEVVKLVAGFREEVLELQRGAVTRRLDQYRASSLDERYKKDPELLKLRNELVTATREGRSTEAYQERLLTVILAKVRRDFETANVNLLPELWRNR